MTEYTNFDSIELSGDLLAQGDITVDGTLTAGSIAGNIATVTALVATADNGITQTLTAAMVAASGGGVWVYHTTTGGTTPSLTLPLASAIISYIPGWTIGDSYTLRIINNNSGVATIVTNTGITLTGTATVNNGSQADFVITYTGAGAVSVVRASVDATNNLDITASTGTLTIANGSSFITSGAYSTTLTATNTTALTLPTTGTLATLAGTETLTNKTLTSPTLTTPSLGVASATTVNKVALTAPATGSTLTIVDGKTLTVSNSLALAGTDSTTMTFPSTSATIARTDSANTFTGASTASAWVLTSPTITTKISPTTDDGAPLGDTTHNFSDLFLASGALVNYANGDAVITHSTGVLTVSTGDWRITNAGTNAASAVTVGGTQTLTNKTLTAPVIGAATGTSISTTGIHTARSGTATPAAASSVAGLTMGSAAVGIYWGTGSPNTALTAPKGSLYLRTDGSTTNDRIYINTDASTAWTNITTAA